MVGMPLGARGDAGATQVSRTASRASPAPTAGGSAAARLAPWEVPRRDPAETRPNAPEGWRSDEPRGERWRERQRVRDAGQRAAAARYEGAQTMDGSARAAARETSCIRRRRPRFVIATPSRPDGGRSVAAATDMSVISMAILFFC
jgi:hypothetical protein